MEGVFSHHSREYIFIPSRAIKKKKKKKTMGKSVYVCIEEILLLSELDAKEGNIIYLVQH